MQCFKPQLLQNYTVFIPVFGCRFHNVLVETIHFSISLFPNQAVETQNLYYLPLLDLFEKYLLILLPVKNELPTLIVHTSNHSNRYILKVNLLRHAYWFTSSKLDS